MHLQEDSKTTYWTGSILESPEMFGSLPPDPNNDRIRLNRLIPWREFDVKYADNFKSKNGQRMIDSRMALGALLIKPAYRALSDDDITKEIVRNPCLQYFLGLHEYRYECSFDPSIMTEFRQRITPEMFAWVNNQIIGRKAEQERKDDDDAGSGGGQGMWQKKTVRLLRKTTRKPSFWMGPVRRRTLLPS